jgi:putative methionine-R-sulfoxide reductase with GAF domain
MAVPIRNADGGEVGWIEVASDQPDAFGEEDRRCLETCAETVATLWNV